MGAPIIGTNIVLAVQSTLGSPTTITAISLANPAVVTSTAHGYANGDYLVLSITSGMAQLDQQAVRLANITSNTYELEGVSTVSSAAFVTGTATKVTAFATFDKAQDITAPNPAPTKLDVTTLLDTVKKYVFGLPDAPDGSITALFNPSGTTEALITAATNANATMVIRMTYSDGRKTLMNSQVSGGPGFTGGPNAVFKSTVSFTPVGRILHFAT